MLLTVDTILRQVPFTNNNHPTATFNRKKVEQKEERRGITFFKKTRSKVVVALMMTQTAMMENSAWCLLVLDRTDTQMTPMTETATIL